MSVLVQHLVVAASALVVVLATTPLARSLGARAGLVSRPGGRHVHERAVPRTGGVALFLGIATALAVRLAGELTLDWPAALTRPGQPLLGLLAGALVMFGVGLADDIFDLRPSHKLLGQIAAGACVYAAGLRVEFVANPFGTGLFLLGVLSLPVTLVWIVGFANVINLIDGLDGLAAGIVAIASVSFALLMLQSNQPLASVFAAAVAGACLGFLRFNSYPATVFMGDSGALTLGFLLACTSMLGVMKSVAAITLVVPLLVIGVPVFDTLSAIIRRRRHGRPIQEADAGHIHHRLLGRGFNQRQTVLIIYIWSIALAIGGYSMGWMPAIYKLLTFAVLAVLSGLMAYWLGLFEAAHHDDE
jgi:UDP-GlcNAc:undecaprenyl-phosphate GlcNAc-1-phosphate transferase